MGDQLLDLVLGDAVGQRPLQVAAQRIGLAWCAGRASGFVAERWAVAPHGVREKLVLAAESAVLCPSNYAQLTVSEYLATQPWREQVKVFRELYRERRDALLDSLEHLLVNLINRQSCVNNQKSRFAGTFEVFVSRSLEEVSGDQRRAAKAINFGLMYGMSAFGLARQLGIGRGEAQDYIALYFSRYPGVRDYMERTRQQAREHGYVETVFGRRLYLEYINKGTQGQRAGAERAAINAPMQGTAADIIKRAMVLVDRWLSESKVDARVILQVHDELVLEVREDLVEPVSAQLRDLLGAAAELAVPLLVEVGVGANWDEAH